MFPKSFPSFLILLFLLSTKPSSATEIYAYKENEYAVVYNGLSPNHRWSLAGHDYEPYEGTFELCLMREPAHVKMAPLAIDWFDTGPLSIAAVWAPDSRHVVILNRSDRRVLNLQLFAVDQGKAQPIPVPALVDLVGRARLRRGAPHELTGRLYRFKWQTPTRFSLEEFDSFDTADPIFEPGLKAYLTVDRRGPQRTFTYFGASAVYAITENGGLILRSVRPIRSWPRKTAYSPHLHFDRQEGLHGIISLPASYYR